MFTGKLGYKLVQVFQSEPTLGPFVINSQFAEEAFTVYDHPKVLLFQKTADFNIQNVQSLLAAAGFPGKTSSPQSSAKNGLMLNADQLQEQQAGGTWSDLFDRNALINQYPGIGLVVWYLFISLLGWAVYPLVRIGLAGLKDRGYPFTKLIGMLLFAVLAWIAGSLNIPVTRNLLIWVFIGLIAVNGLLFFFYRKSILAEIKTNWKHILFIELLGLVFFTFFLLVRLGNPDLWHPWKGGEKPMDFSYLNAVIKSTTFPPYDPWFAGGYINYYYFGFVIAGMPVKLLGIIPSIAYNLILPTFFSLVGLGAFSVGWNIIHRWLDERVEKSIDDHPRKLTVAQVALIAGLIAAIFVLVLGNLGTIRMIWQGFQYLATNGQSIDNVSILQHWIWSFQGFIKFLGGQNLKYPPGDYYWIPSRAIPGEAITEFPYFTFLYGDPHAHMYALPISILAIAWALAMLLRKWKWHEPGEGKGWLNFLVTFFLGGLAIGALRPTNTWDIFTYLPLGIVAILYAGFKYLKINPNPFRFISDFWKKLFIVLGSAGLLVALAYLLYQPFSYWFAQGYNQVSIWTGDYTPFWSYVTHWGLFLFVSLTWIIWEFRDWLATTPATSLKKLIPYQGLIWAGGILLLLAIIFMLTAGIEIAWLVVLMIFFSLLLTLRPNYPEMRRVISFLITLGLTLTLVVELVYLKGDLGRMNTVFKIYMQAWTILAIASAGSVIMLWPAIDRMWHESFRRIWLIALILLIGSAGLFTLLGTMDKIRDRFTSNAPHTLDGMAYMPYTSYSDNGVTYSLGQDYKAIQWMQDNIKGSPVIVEGNETEYRWGTRYTIYTGLPGVVGWNYHQRQQRGVVSSEPVQQRVDEVGEFYSTTDQGFVTNFLEEYNVKYIIVGLMEKAIYPPEGLQKFVDWNGTLWHQIYLDRDTAIYQVGP
jgi:YYY domain-containing protein